MNKVVGVSETFNALIHNHGIFPDNEMPISLDESGKVISYFKDNIWDCSNYAHIYTKQSKIDFNMQCNSKDKDVVIYQIKLVLFYIMFSRKRRYNNITVATINNSFIMLRKIGYLCLDFKCTFSNLQNNRILLQSFKKLLFDLSWESQKKYINILNSIYKAGMLYQIPNFGFNLKFIGEIKKTQISQIKPHKQTLLIPTRIYANFINSGLNFFEELLPYVKNLSELIEHDKFYECQNKTNARLNRKIFAGLVKRNSLEPFFDKYNVGNCQRVLFFLQAVQTLGGLLIICFSGMRRSEALNLNYQSYQELKRRDLHSAWIFKGTTSKFTQVGSVATTWITSIVIDKVIQSLQGIAAIHKIWSEHKGNPIDLDIDQYPLFPSFAVKHEKAFHPIFNMPLGAIIENHNAIYRIIEPIVFSEEDLQELMTFNPLINWLEEYKIEIGKPWKFLPHQFRRSLTVYCARSGLVKIPTLKHQLKHISFDMTLYYGKNYLNAKNFIKESITTKSTYETSLITEFSNQTLNGQLSEFTKNVIQKKTPLFGGEGTRLQMLKDKNIKPSFLTNKNETKKQIFEGKITYRKTALGGCSRVNGCNKLGFSYVTACIPCAYSIFNEDSIDALELAKDSYFRIAQDKFKKGEVLLYEQYIQEVGSIDNLLKKIRTMKIGAKNV